MKYLFMVLAAAFTIPGHSTEATLQKKIRVSCQFQSSRQIASPTSQLDFNITKSRTTVAWLDKKGQALRTLSFGRLHDIAGGTWVAQQSIAPKSGGVISHTLSINDGTILLVEKRIFSNGQSKLTKEHCEVK